MYLANRIPYRCIALVLALLVLSFFFSHFHHSIYIGQHYRGNTPGEAITPVRTNNGAGQPGYFKGQPEWNWEVPEDARWKGNARKPQNNEIVVLTASDGLGHNSAVPNILERVLDDRAKYCARHGYTNLWLNTSRYDIGEAHRVRRLNDAMLVMANFRRHGPKYLQSPRPSTYCQRQNGSGWSTLISSSWHPLHRSSLPSSAPLLSSTA